MKKENPKNIIRKKFLKIRNSELIIKKSLIYQQVEKFIKKLFEDEPYKKNLYIGIYWPLPGEIDLRKLKESIKAKFALPCCNKQGEMNYRKWSNIPLSNDYCGIPSPLLEPIISPEEMGVIFVPALSVDKNGTRLGYGGGFFDRLRKNSIWRSVISVVVLPEACFSKKLLPYDEWDIPFNICITENGKYKINNL